MAGITTFDPAERFSNDLFAMRNRLAEARQILDSLDRSREHLEAENARLRAEREALQVFTEAEAAELLRVTPLTLSGMRKTHRLPHVSTGKAVLYTARHIRQILDHFEVNKTPAARVKRAA